MPAKTPKRKREATPDNNVNEPVTPPRSGKKSKTARTPAKTPAQIEEAVAKKAASVKEKADRAAIKAANAAKRKEAAAAKKAETERKKQWKRDWEMWVTENNIKDTFFTSFEEDCVTTSKAKQYLRLQAHELECLPHDERPNPQGFKAPMKLYKYDEVVDLAYKKEAIQAGVSQDDEELLIAQGKKLYEANRG